MTRRRLLSSLALAPMLRAAPIFGLLVNTQPKYVISIGQSLSIGGAGDPKLSVTQPYTNRTFNGGDLMTWNADFANPVASITSLVPLIEGIVHDDESHMAGFANQISAWAALDGAGSYLDTIQCSWGVGATAYAGLKKGTVPYASSITSVSRAKVLAPGVIVPALLCVHGEADGSCAYAPKLVEWQSDYETDIKAITGQSGTIPMFISQVQVGECNSGATYTGMLGAFQSNPTKLILACPKYIFPYIPAGVHLTNLGYRWVGEYYAKAYYQQIVRGIQWSPLRPLTVSTSGNIITIQMTGFVAPLVFDTVNVAQLSDGNYGFEYFPGVGGETITNVAITDPTAGIVRITLSGTATGNGHCMRYAYTGAPTGPITGVRGCLRDSDPLISRSGNTLYNWCVHFSQFLTYP